MSLHWKQRNFLFLLRELLREIASTGSKTWSKGNRQYTYYNFEVNNENFSVEYRTTEVAEVEVKVKVQKKSGKKMLKAHGESVQSLHIHNCWNKYQFFSSLYLKMKHPQMWNRICEKSFFYIIQEINIRYKHLPVGCSRVLRYRFFWPTYASFKDTEKLQS